MHTFKQWRNYIEVPSPEHNFTQPHWSSPFQLFFSYPSHAEHQAMSRQVSIYTSIGLTWLGFESRDLQKWKADGYSTESATLSAVFVFCHPLSLWRVLKKEKNAPFHIRLPMFYFGLL